MVLPVAGGELPDDEALALADGADLAELMKRAAGLRDEGHGNAVTYSRKVFIPLTHLCRDSCHYCTFAHPPRRGEHCYMTPEDVLEVARKGEAAGCREALFTLGDKPELRYRRAADELRARLAGTPEPLEPARRGETPRASATGRRRRSARSATAPCAAAPVGGHAVEPPQAWCAANVFDDRTNNFVCADAVGLQPA